jgi:hypothetical protein
MHLIQNSKRRRRALPAHSKMRRFNLRILDHPKNFAGTLAQVRQIAARLKIWT